MAAIRFFTDEDVYGTIAVVLRRARIDARSTPEVVEKIDKALRYGYGEKTLNPQT